MLLVSNLWTLKECYIKAVGKGLSIPLNSISFEIGDNNIVSAELEDGAPPYFFKQYLDYEGYVLSLCSYVDATPVIRQLDYEKLRTYLGFMKPCVN